MAAGPYRYLRHPNYVGVTGELVGVGADDGRGGHRPARDARVWLPAAAANPCRRAGARRGASAHPGCYTPREVSLSRREFVGLLGRGGAAATVAGRLVAARGHEALGEFWTGAAASSSIQLDSNENPDGPGPRALDAVRGAFGVANRYPYGEAATLRSAVARALDVRPANVLLGCGSAEVLRMTMQAFSSRTKPLVTAAPTFETPAAYAGAFGVPVQAVPVDAAFGSISSGWPRARAGAGVVYLCNPNNPTGTIVPTAAVSQFVERLAVASPQTVVLVDEAYHEYVDDPAYGTAVPLVLRHSNVVVSRTFSKVYGMAGLRCGYGVAHADTIAKLSVFKLATSVNQLAIAAALASLGDREHVADERARNREARQYTRRLFEALGCRVVPSEANFLLVDLGRDARFFRDGCRHAGVRIGRAFPPLDTCARISIGTMDEMQRAGEAFTRRVRRRGRAGRG